MSLELANNLLNAFGITIGLDGLSLDDQGYCCLRFDDLDTHLQYDQESDHLVVFARLGKLEEEAKADGCAWMMAANLFWAGTNGATLALQPSVNLVFIQAKVLVQGLESERFQSWMEAFVGAADRWVGNLEKLNTGESLAGDEEPPPTPPGPDGKSLYV